jgi:hypothetical protein
MFLEDFVRLRVVDLAVDLGEWRINHLGDVLEADINRLGVGGYRAFFLRNRAA